MRRVINSTYMTVDGVVEQPQNWTFPYRSADAEEYARDLLFSCDAVIMGRRTYEVFVQVWPNLTDEAGMADRMNSLPKHVASDTLTDPAWSHTTVTGVKDFPALVRELKSQEGQDIVQYGYGPLTATLIRERLLDELRLWVHPLFYGKATPTDVISHHSVETTFRLSDVRRFDSGMVVLAYQLT